MIKFIIDRGSTEIIIIYEEIFELIDIKVLICYIV